MKNNPILFFIVAFLGSFAAIAASGAWAADDGKVSFAAGFDYSTGNYGAASSTSILSIPVIGIYSSDLWTFRLTVPYVRISGPGGISANGIRTKAAATNKTTTESGLGDVVAAASYHIYPESEKESRVDLTGKIKLGTASTALGTGQNDFAAQIDVYQGFDRFTATAALGYEFLGSPAGVSMNNVAYGTLGGYYQITEQTVGGAEVRLAQKPSTIGAEQRELSIYASHSMDSRTRIRGYLLKGFADGSPDSGFGLLLISDL